MQMTEAGIGRKLFSDGIYLGDEKDLGAGREWQRAGNQTRYSSHSLLCGTPCGHPEREGSAEERWELAGGGDIQVDGRSIIGRFGGG